MLKGERDRDESVGQTMRERENHFKILERKAESAIRGDNEAQRKKKKLKLLWKLEDGKQRSSDVAFF